MLIRVGVFFLLLFFSLSLSFGWTSSDERHDAAQEVEQSSASQSEAGDLVSGPHVEVSSGGFKRLNLRPRCAQRRVSACDGEVHVGGCASERT